MATDETKKNVADLMARVQARKTQMRLGQPEIQPQMAPVASRDYAPALATERGECRVTLPPKTTAQLQDEKAKALAAELGPRWEHLPAAHYKIHIDRVNLSHGVPAVYVQGPDGKQYRGIEAKFVGSTALVHSTDGTGCNQTSSIRLHAEGSVVLRKHW